jgi:HEPN domain-containing protein
LDKEKQIQYWITASELDWKTAGDIFASNKNLHFCLFICHLVIEKLLKALVVKETNEHPVKTHNLLRLAEIAKLDLKDEDIKFFGELNQFQMDTRYPDEKFALYKLATKDFTEERFNKTEKLRLWLTSKIQK